MQRICGWCGKDLGAATGNPPPGMEALATHGICDPCRDKLVSDAARAEELVGADELEAFSAEALRPMVGVGEDKVYQGWRKFGHCWVTFNGLLVTPHPLFPKEGFVMRVPDKSLALLPTTTPCPDGQALGNWDWGNRERGASNLASAILQDFAGDAAVKELSLAFRDRVISDLPRYAWILTDTTVRLSIEAIREGRITCREADGDAG